MKPNRLNKYILSLLHDLPYNEGGSIFRDNLGASSSWTLSTTFFSFIPCISALGLVFAVSSEASAATIAAWDLSTETQANSIAATNTAEIQGIGVTSATIARGSGLTATTGAAGSFYSLGFEGTAAGASSTEYVSFTVAFTNIYDLTSLSLAMLGSGTGPGTMGLFYSGDSFATALGSKAVTGTLSSWVIDLSSLADVTGTVEFRLIEIGNLNINGTAATAAGGSFRVADNAALGDVRLEGTIIPPAGTNYYFDVDGATAGSGVTDTAYNFSASNWSSSSVGDVATGSFTSNQTPTFSAETDASDNTYTVNIDTAVSANGLSFQEGNVTLAHTAGGTLTLTSAAIDVLSPATANIQEVIAGSVGLTKTGTGALTLSGANTFTGNVGINGGSLSISSNGNLGDAANDLVFGGGSLVVTSPITLGADRSISGTGTINSAGALTIAGPVAMAGTLTLANSGTIDLTDSGSKSFGGLVFSTASTLSASSGGGLTLGTSGIAASATSGTTTVSAPITFSGVSTITVAAGGTLDLTQNLTMTGINRVTTAGPGTLVLDGTSTNGGFRIGISLASPTNGGTVQISSAAALGAGQLQFNYGTVNATSAIDITQGASIGGRAGAVATFAGSDTTVSGPVALFAAGGATGAHQINVNNNTAFTGTFSNAAAAANGLVIGGTGKLTVATASADIDSAITLANSVTLVVNGDLTGSTGALSIAAGTKLAGTGTVSGATSISGTHAVGNAGIDGGVGKQTFSSTLSYGSGSIFEWDLNGNTTSNRGLAGGFDAVDGSGALSVDGTASTGTIFKIVLGAGVNLADAFWSTPNTTQTWSDIFSGFTSLDGGFDTSNLQVVGQSISGIGSFSVSGTSLTWSAVPEPTSALAGLLLGAGLLRRRRLA